MPNLPVSMSLKADLNQNGTFEEDWSAYLESFETGIGREAAVDAFAPRKLTAVLDNADGRFSPRNNGGPYYNKLKRGRRVQLSATVNVAALTNKVTNPSFETDTAGWAETDADASMTFARTTDKARYGKYSVRLVNTAAGQDDYIEHTFSYSGTGSHLITVWVYVSSITAGALSNRGLYVEAVGGGDPSAASTLDASHVTGQWVKHTVLLILGAGTTSVKIRLYGPQGTVHWDAVLFKSGSGSTPYMDGDSAGASWAGTAHASESTRGANPVFTLFTGELRQITLGRDEEGIGKAVYEATGLMETLAAGQISAGPFMREKAELIVRRLMDILESSVASRVMGIEGEAIVDGARRYNGGSGNFSAQLGTVNSQVNAQAFDVIDWLSIEGDYVVEAAASGAGNHFQWRYDATSKINFNKPHKASVFLSARDAGAVSKQVELSLRDQTGALIGAGAVVTLPASTGEWVYAETTGTPTSPTHTTVYLQVKSVDAMGVSGDRVWADCLHLAPISGDPSATLLPSPVFLGTKWTGDLEYMDAYREKAQPVLDEAAKSVGGWLYERGDGTFVFEDYSQRDPAVITIPKLRLSDEPEDGLPYVLSAYDELPSSLAGTVQVSSYGTLYSLNSHLVQWFLWSLEPAGIAFSANEERLFFAPYTATGEISVIARQAALVILPSGFQAAPASRVENFGRAADVYVKDDGTPSTLDVAKVRALAYYRGTQPKLYRTGTAFGFDVEPVLELEMPAQAYQSQAMIDVATWAKNKYQAGPATVKVVIEGLSTEIAFEVFGRDVGLPVYLKHKLGPGNYGLEAMFFAESRTISWEKGKNMRVEYSLEEAT